MQADLVLKITRIAFEAAAGVCRDQAIVYDDEHAKQVCEDCAEAILKALEAQKQ